MIYIGIDPGTHTGVAVWDTKERNLLSLETLPIHQALIKVMMWRDRVGHDLQVVFEDARQRTWFGKDKNTSAKLQGAGSIKRDCSIWEDFLTDYEIPFRAVPPQKGCTKWDDKYFKMVTGWKGKTSNHSRDAAILVFGK
jgi:hypothetical protein